MIKGFEEDKGEIHRSWKDKMGSMGVHRRSKGDTERPRETTGRYKKPEEETGGNFGRDFTVMFLIRKFFQGSNPHLVPSD
jgi:hypothetical protein